MVTILEKKSQDNLVKILNFYDTSAMEKDIRWEQRFENLEKALHRLREALRATIQEPKNSLYQIALIGAFQFTFELSWKTMKDYLQYQGVDVSLPRDVLKQAYHHKILNEGQIWIEMLEDRNMMAQVYQEQAAEKAEIKIQSRYIHEIESLHQFFSKKREK